MMGAGDGPASTVYSAADLAERWGCSAGTVRRIIRPGELEAFRLGPSFLRVRAEALADYEARKAPKVKAPEEREAERRSAEAWDLAFRAVMIVERERRRRVGRG